MTLSCLAALVHAEGVAATDLRIELGPVLAEWHQQHPDEAAAIVDEPTRIIEGEAAPRPGNRRDREPRKAGTDSPENGWKSFPLSLLLVSRPQDPAIELGGGEFGSQCGVAFGLRGLQAPLLDFVELFEQRSGEG